MARHRPDGSEERPGAAEILGTTFVPAPRGPTFHERILAGIGVRRRPAVGFAVALAAVGAIVASALAGAHHGAGAEVRERGPAGVAAAYEYPLRCLTVTISASDSAYARAELDRASPCWRYGAYVTAVFHRRGGAWRRVLDATAYSCPVRTLPAVVQAELALCPLWAAREEGAAASPGAGCRTPVPVTSWIWRETVYACWNPH